MKKNALIAALAALAAGLPAAHVVRVDAAARGPRIPAELYSHNWNAYDKSGDGSDPAYNAAVRAMGAGLLRVPGGGYASLRTWDDITCGGRDASWLVDHAGMLAFAKATGVELNPIVNFGGHWCGQDHGYDAAIRKAAEWVRHLNVDPKARYARYWEIGNEIYYENDKAHTDGKTYGEQFARFAKAMKAVDPGIKLGFNLFENRDAKKLPWNLAALRALKASGVKADYYAVHMYPIWMPKEARGPEGAPEWNRNWYADHPDMDKAILKNVELVERYTKELDQTIDEVLGQEGRAPYWMTEFRSALELKFIEWVDTLFVAQVLLEMGRLGWGGSHVWALKNGFELKTQADFGLLRTGRNPDVFDDMPANSPRPAYYVYPFLSRAFGRQMVRAQGSGPVRAWAALREDGTLTLFLVNNDLPGSAQTARVDLAGFKPAPQAEAWFLEPAGTTVHDRFEPLAHRRDISVNGVRRPDPASLPGPARTLKAGSSFSVELPPLGMALIRLKPGS